MRTAFLFWVFAIFLGSFIHQNLNEVSAATPSEPTDPLSRLVGSAKEVIGDTLFVKADIYFHGGVMHGHPHDESAETLETEGVFHEAKQRPEEAPGDWIAKINREIQTHTLMHLSKEKRKEMLPFFALSTALDPRNVEAVLTAAYWLEHEFGKTEDAIELLKKGVRDNPSSWETENALGRLYFRQKKDWTLAEWHLREAVRKSESGKIENFERVQISYYLGETYLALGKKNEALGAYRNASRYFDGKTTLFLQSVILNKIKELSAAV